SGPPAPAVAKPSPSPMGASPFSRSRALASLTTWCKIPIDAAHPDPALGPGVADWGRVTRREEVTGTFAEDREVAMLLYEVRGQRATYRFNGASHAHTIGTLDVPVGQLVALCEDPQREPSTLYELPAPWKGPLNLFVAALPISGPPLTASFAKLAPLHLPALTLRRDGGDGRISIASNRRYLVHAKVEGADGDRWDMGQWWLEVPRGTRGAGLVATGQLLWFVIEQPTLEATADPKHPKLVVRAVHVQDELFPR
ncbi:MAG: hypothetical protein M3680_34015, partial [Myxococcota bacterium]|nr:hypothetical protein [Myxococcota bacterium]